MKFKQKLLILSAILVAVLILAAGCLPAPTTPLVDTDAPKLSTAVYTDVDSSGTVNLNDRVIFTFNDEMEKSTITSSNVSSRLPLSASSYGTGPTVSWNVAGTVCTVTLGTLPDIPYGTTVYPSSSVTDVAGNAADPSVVTISGLLNVLASVSITPSTATTTAGGATVTLTAIALNTVGGDITTLCTLTWTISGIGSISTTTGSSTVYTSPPSGTGTATITVTAVYAGVTGNSTATITVGAPPTSLVDPNKLFVSAQTATAKYTTLPAGATVTVYSHANLDPLAAVAAGAKATIILSDWWTPMSGIAANDHIYFIIAYADGTTSPVTYDGQLPDAPNVAALAKIQATSKNMVTSSAGGNMSATDKIALYVVVTRYSDPTPVGTTMTFATNLTAIDVPLYTRTNADGHESLVSGADGAIVKITGAAYAGGAANGIVEAGETITITYSGNIAVTVASLSFVLGGTTITADLAPGAANTAVLTITGGPYDLSAQVSVDFNLAHENIVDNAGGGNWALEHASGIVWIPTVDF